MSIVLDGTNGVTAPNLSLGGAAVTATAAELNVVDGASTTQAPLILSQPSAFVDPENRIINGAFDFWQRGTSFTLVQFGSDRWINNFSGGTVTQSRQAHTIGDKFGSNTPQFYLRQTVSGQSLASHLAVTTQRIEGVRSYAGETITVLGWVRRSSGSGNMVVEGSQRFGTGGSPSANVNAISPTTITLTSDWEPFAAVLTVPSIAGKTIGSDGNDHLELNFWTSAGSDWNARTNSLGIQTIGVDLWGIHIKRGTHTAAATDFYKAPELGPELVRCRRYCRVSASRSAFDYIIGSAHFETTTVLNVAYDWSGMRATPAITASGTFQGEPSGGAVTLNSVSLFGSMYLRIAFSAGTASTVGISTNIRDGGSNTARLTFDAEL